MQDSQTPLIKEINYGIACRIGNTIYINKRIKKYSSLLYDSIILHEKRHTRGFSLRDILLDVRNEEIAKYKKDYYKFILSEPSAWIEFSPICKYDGKFVVSPLILGLWGLTGGVLWLIAGLLK